MKIEKTWNEEENDNEGLEKYLIHFVLFIFHSITRSSRSSITLHYKQSTEGKGKSGSVI